MPLEISESFQERYNTAVYKRYLQKSVFMQCEVKENRKYRIGRCQIGSKICICRLISSVYQISIQLKKFLEDILVLFQRRIICTLINDLSQ